MTPAVAKQRIWTPICTLPLVNLGNTLKEPFAMFMGHDSKVFRKKIQMRRQKMKFQWHFQFQKKFQQDVTLVQYFIVPTR
jgi:hypothetical protein